MIAAGILALCGAVIGSPGLCVAQNGPIAWDLDTKTLRTSSGQVITNVTLNYPIAQNPSTTTFVYVTHLPPAGSVIFADGFE